MALLPKVGQNRPFSLRCLGFGGQDFALHQKDTAGPWRWEIRHSLFCRLWLERLFAAYQTPTPCQTIKFLLNSISPNQFFGVVLSMLSVESSITDCAIDNAHRPFFTLL